MFLNSYHHVALQKNDNKLEKIRCLQTSLHIYGLPMQRTEVSNFFFLLYSYMKNRCKNLVNLHDFVRQNHLAMFVSLDSQSGTKH